MSKLRQQIGERLWGRLHKLGAVPSGVAWQVEPAGCSKVMSVADALKLKPEENRIAEVKHDGIRYELQIQIDHQAFLTSRQVSKLDGRMVEKQHKVKVPHNGSMVAINGFPFPEEWADSCFDGEFGGKGISCNAQHDILHGKAVYVVFDCLKFAGRYIGALSRRARRAFLEKLFKSGRVPNWMRLVEESREPAKLLKRVLQEGGEGIVLKTQSDSYGVNWTKVKKVDTTDAVICGYEESKSADFKSKGWIGAIKFGQFMSTRHFERLKERNPKQKYELVSPRKVCSNPPAGHVFVCFGTLAGITQKLRDSISKNQKGYLGEVIEMKSNHRFSNGLFRSPRFLRIRDDKPAKDCIFKLDL